MTVSFQRVFQEQFKFSKLTILFPQNIVNKEKKLSHVGERVEINVLDSSDIHAAMKELREIQNI